MQIIRGDDYQSWVYSNKEDLVVVDPWLTKKTSFPKISLAAKPRINARGISYKKQPC